MKNFMGYLKRAMTVLLSGAMVLAAVPQTVYADLIDEDSDYLIAEDNDNDYLISADEDATGQDVILSGDEESPAVIKQTHEGKGTFSEAGQDDTDALLEGYIEQLVMEKIHGDNEISPDGVARRESLVGANQYLYDFMAGKIQKVAKGEISSTVFETGEINLKPYYGGKNSFTKEELGVSNLNSDEAVDADSAKL